MVRGLGTGLKIIRGFSRAGRGSRAIALVGALIVNAVIAIGVFIRSVPSPQAFFSTYDTPFHMSVIRWLIESGDGSSLHSAAVDGTVGSHFYPALWHGWVSMVIPAWEPQ